MRETRTLKAAAGRPNPHPLYLEGFPLCPCGRVKDEGQEWCGPCITRTRMGWSGWPGGSRRIPCLECGRKMLSPGKTERRCPPCRRETARD